MLLFDWTNRWTIFVGMQPLKKKNRSILCQNTVMLLNLLKARTHVVHPQGHVSVKELPNVSIVLTLLLRFYENPRVDWKHSELDLLEFPLTHFPNSSLARIPLNFALVLLPPPISLSFSLFCRVKGTEHLHTFLSYYLDEVLMSCLTVSNKWHLEIIENE